jgi:DNA-directed RNA polymerase subunit L
MNIKIVEDTKGRVVFEIIGGDNTLSNILKETIAKQKGVTACAYNIEHPLVSNPKFIVEADNAGKAITAAIDALKKENNDFKKQVEAL